MVAYSYKEEKAEETWSANLANMKPYSEIA